MDLTTPIITQGVLGVAVVALSFVIIRLWSKIEKLEQEKVEILKAWRDETKEDGKDALDVLKGNSQSLLYLANKIEVGKEADKRQSK